MTAAIVANERSRTAEEVQSAAAVQQTIPSLASCVCCELPSHGDLKTSSIRICWHSGDQPVVVFSDASKDRNISLAVDCASRRLKRDRSATLPPKRVTVRLAWVER